MVIVLSLAISDPTIEKPAYIEKLEQLIPQGSRLMSSDPSEIYYYTGIGGIPIPDENPEVALELARLYGVDYLLLEDNHITKPMQFTEAPNFLQPVDLNLPEVRLYAFQPD